MDGINTRFGGFGLNSNLGPKIGGIQSLNLAQAWHPSGGAASEEGRHALHCVQVEQRLMLSAQESIDRIQREFDHLNSGRSHLNIPEVRLDIITRAYQVARDMIAEIISTLDKEGCTASPAMQKVLEELENRQKQAEKLLEGVGSEEGNRIDIPPSAIEQFERDMALLTSAILAGLVAIGGRLQKLGTP